ncbi:MAG: hypothetical protein IJH04_06855 [Eggerthellaceae bacterium]|nr:hypothetical protein [Eggerthellaceae bacterium]
MPENVDRSVAIFGNDIDVKTYTKACRTKAGYVKKYGDDAGKPFHLRACETPVIGEILGVRQLVSAGADSAPFDIFQDAELAGSGKPVIIGNIRMGFGHYRIAMAMASAARALGYTPYWLDLAGFPETTCSKVISHQNDLYSLGSRLSQTIPAFNKLYWEPLNSEGFRKLTYNASDQKVSELMVAPFADLPSDVPFIGTHAWPSQAAVHAGLANVVNAIPDNWPMALHLAEGSIHAVQTPKCYYGYKALDGFDAKRELKPMPDDAIAYTGHYVDHELVANIPFDCARRRNRIETGEPVRYLLSVGGAGAQQALFAGIIEHLLPYIESGEATLFVNVGDHRDVWSSLANDIPALEDAVLHFDDFEDVQDFSEEALDNPVEGIHAFCDSDIFSAVYSTNLLMRACDILITKPSELSFYPVPKMMIQRVGGHEAWGAIRAHELGDGTAELETPAAIYEAIDGIQADRSAIAEMCDAIERNDEDGIYNGAYRVVRLATQKA